MISDGTKVEGVSGVIWWVDATNYNVYLSMAVSKLLASFRCGKLFPLPERKCPETCPEAADWQEQLRLLCRS